eukprot:scaffold255552_cov35-Attheya_sp.AAC.2
MAPCQLTPNFPLIPISLVLATGIPTTSVSPLMSVSDIAFAITNGSARHPDVDTKMEAYSRNATNKVKTYTKARWNLWRRMKNTLEFDPYLGHLMEIDPNTDPNDDSPREKFFTALKGEKTQDKKIILNQSMILIVLLWKKQDGDEYEPNSWVTMTSGLFFFCEYGIDYKVEVLGCYVHRTWPHWPHWNTPTRTMHTSCATTKRGDARDLRLATKRGDARHEGLVDG